MLSKMAAQQPSSGGRRVPLSLSGGAGGNSNNSGQRPPQTGGANVNSNAKNAVQKSAAESTSSNAKKQQQQNETRASERTKDSQNGVGKNQNGDKDKSSNTTQNGTNGNIGNNAANKQDSANGADKKLMKKVKVDLKTMENNKEAKNVTENVEKKTENTKDATTTANDNAAKVSAVQLAEQKDAPKKSETTNAQPVEPAKQPSEPVVDLTGETPDTSKEITNATEPSTPERRSGRKSNQKPTTPVQAASASPKQVVEPVLVTPKKNSSVIAEDIEMVDNSPIKPPTANDKLSAVVNAAPAATSTPGKLFGNKAKQTSDLPLNYTPDRKNCPRNFSQISGRRSIRPAGEFTPSHYRESYRRINTELDVTSNTNTSLNVTVGSERPNNSSFSFSFWGGGISRKRERTPTASNSQSTSDLRTDIDMSPPKRARIEKPGFFSGLINSPMTALRSAFTRTSLQTPTKPLRLEQTPSGDEADDDVQNVSGIDIEEEITQSTENIAATSDTEDDITVGNKAGAETPVKGSPIKPAATDSDVADVDKADAEQQLQLSATEDPKASVPNTCGIASDAAANGSDDSDVQFEEIAAADKKASRCSVM